MALHGGRMTNCFIGRRVSWRLANFLAVLFLQGLVFTPVFAQDAVSRSVEAGEAIKAGLYISPPFVTRTKDGFSGMAVELWNALATNRSIDTEFIEYPTLSDLVHAVGAGEVDVAVTNLTITAARAEHVDFTQPWFDAGLQIMISDAPRSGFGNLVAGLASSGHLRAFAWIAGVIVFATALLTLFDRRFDQNFPTRWREGIAESFYAVMSVAVSGRAPSRKNLFGWVGRIWSAMWLICGVAVLAYVTSSVTTVMTTLALTDHISSLSDLPGKKIGVLSGSTADDFATTSGLSKITFANIDSAVEALVSGQIDAIVGDSPVLQYYEHTRPQHDVSVVGAIFQPDKYGFGLAQDSSLRKPLTVGLIGAAEAGLIEELRTKYFGARQ